MHSVKREERRQRFECSSGHEGVKVKENKIILQCPSASCGEEIRAKHRETKTMFSLPEGGGMPGKKKENPARSAGKNVRSVVQATLENASLGRKNLRENQCSACHQAAEGKARREQEYPARSARNKLYRAVGVGE